MGTFGIPPDWAALAALLVAMAWTSLAVWRFGRTALGGWMLEHPRTCLGALAAAAMLLSYAYVLFYLRGGPRIIDATAYYLQARTFASGSWLVNAQMAPQSLAGRFLLLDPDGQGLAVIFPPGYALVLALGFLTRTPMLVGPVLGG